MILNQKKKKIRTLEYILRTRFPTSIWAHKTTGTSLPPMYSKYNNPA